MIGGLRFFVAEQLIEVARDEIDFDVNTFVGGERAEVCFFQCLGDEFDRAGRVGEMCDGEADAVDGYRAFEREKAHECGRRLDFEGGDGFVFCRFRVFCHGDDAGGAVDVALYEVAADEFSERERGFEIDDGPHGVVADDGACAGFGDDVEVYDGVFWVVFWAVVGLAAGYREADTVDGD